MLQDNIRTHVSLIVDRSSSMSGQPVDIVFDIQLAKLKQRSIELNQETRISIYLFGSDVECLAFDMDVMRFKSLKGFWRPDGMTAMLDAILLSIKDHKTLPQQYGSHGILQFVITDGQNNIHNHLAPQVKQELERLPDNWTTGCLVPDIQGIAEAKRFGFDRDSIAVWSTSGAFEEVGDTFDRVVTGYMTMRATGKRGTSKLFALDASNITKTKVRTALTPLSGKEYDIIPVRTRDPKGVRADEYITAWQGEFRLGSAYYMPTKPVEIQRQKAILIQDKKTGKVYEGPETRQMLGLPDFTVKVNPSDHKDWQIYVQSTAPNRKLFDGTFVLVRK